MVMKFLYKFYHRKNLSISIILVIPNDSDSDRRPSRQYDNAKGGWSL